MNIIAILIIIVICIIIFNFVKMYQLSASDTMPNKEMLTSVDQVRQTVSPNSVYPKLGLYYTEWCGYSRKMFPIWNELVDIVAKQNVPIDLFTVDCDKNSEQCASNSVFGYPTILLHKSNTTTVYEGARTAQDILTYIRLNLE
jgi:hypothetical protein